MSAAKQAKKDAGYEAKRSARKEMYARESQEKALRDHKVACFDDLLEALKAIKERLDACHLHVLGGHEVFDSFYTDLIDSVIAKATGAKP